MHCLHAPTAPHNIRNALCFFSNQLEKLEVDPSVRRDVDFGNIVREKTEPQPATQSCAVTQSENFIDDPDVPPLI